MSLLTTFSEHEQLQWKLALLRHRPADLPDRHMAHYGLSAMQQRAVRGDLSMPPHWEQAVLAWRSHGFSPQSYLVLHRAVDDLARLGYQIPVEPPARSPSPAQSPSPTPGRSPVPSPPDPPAPARRTPRRYRSWGGRPNLGPYALDPREWSGAGDWIASAGREVVLDVLEAREQAEEGRVGP